VPEDFRDRLVGRTIDSPTIACAIGNLTASVANSMVVGAVHVSNGDILFNSEVAMEVLACVKTEVGMLLLIRKYIVVRKHGAGRLWKVAPDTAAFAPATGYSQPSTWTFQADGLLLTIP